MKRILSIIFVTVAAFNLAMLTVMPHHHHGAVMCATAEHCLQDNVPGTDGDHTDNSLRYCAACAGRTDSLVSSGHPLHHHQPLPALLFATGFMSEPAALSIPSVAYGFAEIFCIPAGVHSHAGLRAPPSLS
jgi:hypothetical protein